MARLCARAGTAAAFAAAAAGWAGLAHACDNFSGFISSIEGRPQDVVITRTESGVRSVVARPARVLDIVCRGDVVHPVGTTSVLLSIDGGGTVRIDHGIDYTVPARSGGPTVFGNALRAIDEVVMPDMKRLPWNVRIKGVGDDFGFALPGLTEGGQQVHAGSRTLLVRLVGGTAPYKVEIRNAQDAVVATQTSPSHEVVLPGVTLSAGPYRLIASDATPRVIDAAIMVVDAGPPVDATYDGFADPEMRSAYGAVALARAEPATWTFEAEQQLEAAPANGLDRDKVYELIESYPD